MCVDGTILVTSGSLLYFAPLRLMRSRERAGCTATRGIPDGLEYHEAGHEAEPLESAEQVYCAR